MPSPRNKSTTDDAPPITDEGRVDNSLDHSGISNVSKSTKRSKSVSSDAKSATKPINSDECNVDKSLKRSGTSNVSKKTKSSKSVSSDAKSASINPDKAKVDNLNKAKSAKKTDYRRSSGSSVVKSKDQQGDLVMGSQYDSDTCVFPDNCNNIATIGDRNRLARMYKEYLPPRFNTNAELDRALRTFGSSRELLEEFFSGLVCKFGPEPNGTTESLDIQEGRSPPGRGLSNDPLLVADPEVERSITTEPDIHPKRLITFQAPIQPFWESSSVIREKTDPSCETPVNNGLLFPNRSPPNYATLYDFNRLKAFDTIVAFEPASNEDITRTLLHFGESPEMLKYMWNVLFLKYGRYFSPSWDHMCEQFFRDMRARLYSNYKGTAICEDSIMLMELFRIHAPEKANEDEVHATLHRLGSNITEMWIILTDNYGVRAPMSSSAAERLLIPLEGIFQTTDERNLKFPLNCSPVIGALSLFPEHQVHFATFEDKIRLQRFYSYYRPDASEADVYATLEYYGTSLEMLQKFWSLMIKKYGIEPKVRTVIKNPHWYYDCDDNNGSSVATTEYYGSPDSTINDHVFHRLRRFYNYYCPSKSDSDIVATIRDVRRNYRRASQLHCSLHHKSSERKVGDPLDALWKGLEAVYGPESVAVAALQEKRMLLHMISQCKALKPLDGGGVVCPSVLEGSPFPHLRLKSTTNREEDAGHINKQIYNNIIEITNTIAGKRAASAATIEVFPQSFKDESRVMMESATLADGSQITRPVAVPYHVDRLMKFYRKYDSRKNNEDAISYVRKAAISKGGFPAMWAHLLAKYGPEPSPTDPVVLEYEREMRAQLGRPELVAAGRCNKREHYTKDKGTLVTVNSIQYAPMKAIHNNISRQLHMNSSSESLMTERMVHPSPAEKGLIQLSFLLAGRGSDGSLENLAFLLGAAPPRLQRCFLIAIEVDVACFLKIAPKYVRVTNITPFNKSDVLQSKNEGNRGFLLSSTVLKGDADHMDLVTEGSITCDIVIETPPRSFDPILHEEQLIALCTGLRVAVTHITNSVRFGKFHLPQAERRYRAFGGHKADIPLHTNTPQRCVFIQSISIYEWVAMAGCSLNVLRDIHLSKATGCDPRGVTADRSPSRVSEVY